MFVGPAGAPQDSRNHGPCTRPEPSDRGGGLRQMT